MNYLDYFDNKAVLITGSNGFLGRNLIQMLKDTSARITGLGRRQVSCNNSINYYPCDISDYNRVKEIVDREKPEIIYHLAALNITARDYSLYSEMLNVHARALADLFSILREKPDFKLLVNMGSCEEYGRHGGRPFREDFFEESLSPYAASKTAGAHFACLVGKNEGFPVITVRPGVIFGPWQAEERFIPYVISRLAAGRELLLTPCEQSRDFIPVKAFLEILLRLIASEGYQPGEIYNIASGVSLRLKEVVLYLREAMGSSSRVSFGALPYRKNEIMEFKVSVKKIKTLVEYDLSQSDIRAELLRMIRPDNGQQPGTRGSEGEGEDGSENSSYPGDA